MIRAVHVGLGIAFAAGALTACSLFVLLDGFEGNPEAAADAAPVADAENVGADAENIGADAESVGADASDGGCPAVPADPSLVGYWPLDEGAGSVVRDCSGRGHDGFLIDQPAGGAWAAGRFGSALRVDGNAGCVELGLSADFRLAASGFTAALWINVAGYFPDDNTGYLIGKTLDPARAGWRLATDKIQDVQLKGVSSTGTLMQVNAENLPTSTWLHIAAIYVPGSRAEIYVGGSLVAQEPPLAEVLEDSDAPLRIGCRSNGGLHANALIDDVRLYARGLSAAEIAALAQPR